MTNLGARATAGMDMAIRRRPLQLRKVEGEERKAEEKVNGKIGQRRQQLIGLHSLSPHTK